MVITTIGHLRPLVVFLCTFSLTEEIKFETFQKAMCMSFGTKTSDVNCQIASPLLEWVYRWAKATRILDQEQKPKCRSSFHLLCFFK